MTTFTNHDLEGSTYYIIDRNINTYNHVDDSVFIANNGESFDSNLLSTLPALNEVEQRLGASDAVANGNKNLVLVDAKYLPTGRGTPIPEAPPITIPIPIPTPTPTPPDPTPDPTPTPIPPDPTPTPTPNPTPNPIPDLGLAIVGIVLRVAKEVIKATEVNLTISTFPEGEGLSINDEGFVKRPSQVSDSDLSVNRSGVRDYNPNRVSTLTWKMTDRLMNLGQWFLNGTLISPTPLANNQIALNSLNLTAGQTYYWRGDFYNKPTGIRGRITGGELSIPQPQPLTDTEKTFSSVTVITPDSKSQAGDSTGLKKALELATGIAQNFNARNDNGVILVFDHQTGQWTAPYEEFKPSSNSLPLEFGRPLVLIDNWSNPSAYQNSGFAEESADRFFAALVQFNQAYTGTKQNALFNSSFHFIGHGRGAVVNSETIQRLGTYYPRDKFATMFPDLQMTTIDPHDFAQGGVNYFDPSIQVWENVTFADNYYQTTSTAFHQGRELTNAIPQEWSELNGLQISRADLNIRLDGRAGFAQSADSAADDPHNRAFAWYAGTANVSLDGQNSAFGTSILRRKGDFSQDRFNGGALTPWYTNDFQPVIPGLPWLNRVDLGDPQGQWEGVGTGWYYSALGGGRWRRNTLAPKQNRVLVGFDNTNLARSRGDYAVPTLFNGNFDAIESKVDAQPLPGWSLYNGTNNLVNNAQNRLRTWAQVLPSGSPDRSAYSSTNNTNYALLLRDGDTLTHAQSIVPDWGVLRFDLLSRIDSSSTDNFGSVTVTIEEVGNSSNFKSETIKLENAKNDTVDLVRTTVDGKTYTVKTPASYQADIYRIGYGSQGFETFNINVDDSLRGKAVKISFKNNNSTKPVYLDNVFFKSEALKWGNPTNARNGVGADPNNYLIEKPQYSLSYNQSTGKANWVAWKFNQSWYKDKAGRPVDGFAVDPALTNQGFTPLLTDANYSANYLQSPTTGNAVLNWSTYDDGYGALYEYKGSDPLNKDVDIFTMSENGQSVFGYKYIKTNGIVTGREYVRTYSLNPDGIGEIYYQYGSGDNDKSYYRSSAVNGTEAKPISPNKIYEIDRGHLSPNADRSRTKKDAIATFLTSNILPQQSDNNSNIWFELEESNRVISEKYPNIDTYMIAGGYGINNKYPAISDNQNLDPAIRVPNGLWKVVLSEDRTQPDNQNLFTRFGFYVGNDERKNKWYESPFLYSIGNLENELNSPTNINYDFLNNLSSQRSAQIKTGGLVRGIDDKNNEFTIPLS